MDCMIFAFQMFLIENKFICDAIDVFEYEYISIISCKPHYSPDIFESAVKPMFHPGWH